MVYSLAILMYSKLLYIIYIHGIKGSINATHYRKLINYAVDNQNHICTHYYIVHQGTHNYVSVAISFSYTFLPVV